MSLSVKQKYLTITCLFAGLLFSSGGYAGQCHFNIQNEVHLTRTKHIQQQELCDSFDQLIKAEQDLQEKIPELRNYQVFTI
ncbi:DUF2884 family protein [Vibrio mangrovi]|uniref:Uncharacterized protein n=1 Tax=Vibrio mangrovi TaxID=474394 RepID=A0A1Y6IV00_9VIBR|nr:DUF2884 family protein [Vibrio mangrovi]MDW6001651.1 hypothetical protein [Vibrio mangrovi]SMS00322.1 hypothetical protein VIM7927_01572 [Vibrio mangrovi]